MKSKEEILADEIIKNPVLGDDKKLYIHCDKVLSLMQEYADQQTSTLYTRAQLLEFGEKVKSECMLTLWNLDTPDRPRKDMESINIENLLK